VTRFTASAVFIAVDTAHFAAHGDISGFGGIFEQLSRHGGDAGHTP
ncbi:PaaI family thioesterase, partial [Mycobacteroides abscessus subsp. abscessus]